MHNNQHQHEGQKHRPSDQPCGCNIGTNGQGSPKNTLPRTHCSADQKTGSSPPQAVAQEIPKTIEYRGIKYRLNGKSGHYRCWIKGEQEVRMMLHRQIYIDHFGPIPDGYDVHHIDGNALNNEPSNLMVLSKKEHMQHHANERKQNVEYMQKTLRTNRRNQPPTLQLECHICGGIFEACVPEARYCSTRCNSHAIRTNPKNQETRVCLICGSNFTRYYNNPAKTCSSRCGRAMMWERRKSNQTIQSTFTLPNPQKSSF